MHLLMCGTLTMSSGVVQDVRMALASPLSHVGMHIFVPVNGGTPTFPVVESVLTILGCTYWHVREGAHSSLRLHGQKASPALQFMHSPPTPVTSWSVTASKPSSVESQLFAGLFSAGNVVAPPDS
jgi:hypothetical protein